MEGSIAKKKKKSFLLMKYFLLNSQPNDEDKPNRFKGLHDVGTFTEEHNQQYCTKERLSYLCKCHIQGIHKTKQNNSVTSLRPLTLARLR